MISPKLAQSRKVKKAVLSGTEFPNPWEKSDLHDITARNSFHDRRWIAQTIVISDTTQSGKSVESPEGERDIKPDLITEDISEVGDKMVSASNQGENGKGNVDYQENLVEFGAK